jgi:hypothetical protein
VALRVRRLVDEVMVGGDFEPLPDHVAPEEVADAALDAGGAIREPRCHRVGSPRVSHDPRAGDLRHPASGGVLCVALALDSRDLELERDLLRDE